MRPTLADLPLEDGYELWLRYPVVSATGLLAAYRAAHVEVVVLGDSPTRRAAAEELARGLHGLFGGSVPQVPAPTRDGALVVGVLGDAPELATLAPAVPGSEEACA